MKLTGHIVDANLDFVSGAPKVTLLINEKADFFQGYEKLKVCEKLHIEFKPYSPKRSLNANNYAWQLINDIANELRASKDEIYLKMLKRYGQSTMISVIAEADISEFVKYYEEAGESYLNGKLFKHYRVYKGSSEFGTQEMSILIDGIVSEAKALGIQTETPAELARLKSLWREQKE